MLKRLILFFIILVFSTPAAAFEIGSFGIGGGKIVQVVGVEVGATANTTAIIPADTTIPLNSEGTEFMSLAITPASTSNTLYISVVFNGDVTAARHGTVVLLEDTTVLAAVGMGETTGNYLNNTSFIHKRAAPSGTTTYRVRAGPSSGGDGTLYFNSVDGWGGAAYGGVTASSITIIEVEP